MNGKLHTFDEGYVEQTVFYKLCNYIRLGLKKYIGDSFRYMRMKNLRLFL
jgi:hypothetical protein